MNAAAALLAVVLLASATLAVIVGTDARNRGQWWWWAWAAFTFFVPIFGIAYLLLRNRLSVFQDMRGSPWVYLTKKGWPPTRDDR